MKADLHVHGLIGFEPYWLRAQGVEGKNILKELVDASMHAGMDIIALVSESDQVNERGIIQPRTVHDRFHYLIDTFATSLPYPTYDTFRLGENLFVVTRFDKPLYILNAQTPIIKEGERRYDHLVIGSNAVPNFGNLHDSLSFCNDRELLHGFEHLAVEDHFGIGLAQARKYVDLVDFVEGHNAQLCFPFLASVVPLLRPYTRLSNQHAQAFADEYHKAWIASSDAHRFEDIGLASIQLDDTHIDTSTGEKLLQSLRSEIRRGNFSCDEEYMSLPGWFSWVSTFQRGIWNDTYRRA